MKHIMLNVENDLHNEENNASADREEWRIVKSINGLLEEKNK